MKKYEASARTVEEAIEQGLKELGVSIGDVDVQVLEEGSKGLFGLFGSRLAKVSLTVKDEEEDLLEGLIPEEKEAAPAAPKETMPKQAAPEKKAEKQESPAAAQPAEEEPAKKESARPAPVKRVAPKKAEKKPQPEKAAGPEKEAAPEEGTSAEELTEEKVMEKPEITVIPAEELDPESPVGQAYAFLQEITRLMGVEVSIEMGTDAEGNVYGSMMGDTLGILIGRRGETLDALQYLTSLKVNRGREGYTRVTLDTENYRARREDTLIRLANRMANRATRTGRRVSLEPMNPYERRIIHFALQQNESVTTHSEGDEPNRHVVITVKK
ncbi:MAG: Jag N-terminal domain-containing protein [Clostridiales bacterium]|nr:Jag N-terminal domain-containing protein [Clostridiales bacterium]